MNTVETLKAAKALISDPTKWTQGAYARDAEGTVTDPFASDAACWCSVRSIVAVSREWFFASESLLEKAIGGGVIRFNDMHTHAEVMAAFDRAIELAEADA